MLANMAEHDFELRKRAQSGGVVTGEDRYKADDKDVPSKSSKDKKRKEKNKKGASTVRQISCILVHKSAAERICINISGLCRRAAALVPSHSIL
eukprot:SAG11_NODE_13893_length_634_cov_1.639252_2_plen_94_part_00